MGTKNEFAKESIPKPRWRIPDQDDWTIEMYDVEAALLNADIGHRQFIYVPKAMIKTGTMEEEESKGLAFELTKSMYCNVDAALIFFIKYKEILKDLGMIQCETDPCVFYRVNIQGYLELVIACHVDDSIIAGSKPVIDEYLKAFKNRETWKNEKAPWNMLGMEGSQQRSLP
jgi:hypothetical protein